MAMLLGTLNVSQDRPVRLSRNSIAEVSSEHQKPVDRFQKLHCRTCIGDAAKVRSKGVVIVAIADS